MNLRSLFPVSYTHLDVYKRQVVELIKLLYLLDVQDKFPEVNIVEAYFLVLEGKYIIELIGEKFLKASAF